MFGRRSVGLLRNVTRRYFSAEPKIAATRNKAALQTSSSSGNTKYYVIFGTLAALGGCAYDISSNKDGALNKLYNGSALERAISSAWREVQQRLQDDVYMPSSDRLLPDFPNAPCYANIPPGTPAPPLLVVDLEKTLIGSVYDAQYGWRHAKRPGMDAFINSLSQYYEIAIISENDIGAVTELMMKIDPEGKCHKFGNAALEMRGDSYIKRLDLMNRDIRKIILIDDNPASYEGFEDNVLRVKPYTDVSDKRDRVLLDLIPLLQAVVHEQASDFRKVLNNLGTHDAQEAAIEYQMRLAKKKEEEWGRRNKGLGRVLRGGVTHNAVDLGDSASALPSIRELVGDDGSSSGSDRGGASEENGSSSRSGINKSLAMEAMSVPAPPKTLLKTGYLKEVVGDAGEESRPAKTASKKKGALFSWLDDAAARNAEYEARKMEKMNEIYMKRQMAKMEAAEREKALRMEREQNEM